MKYIIIVLGISLLTFGCGGQQSTNNDFNAKVDSTSLEKVTIEGIFDGVIINKLGYKISDYYIAITDITDEQRQEFTGKKVKLTGTLRVVDGSKETSIQSTKDVKKYIDKPVIEIIN